MGGTDFGRESRIYNGIESMRLDAVQAATQICNRCIKADLISMDEKQLACTKDEVGVYLQTVRGFTSCMEDLLVHLYNQYVARPLKLKERSLQDTVGRKVLTADGLVDNR